MAAAPTESGCPGPEQPSAGRKRRDKPVCLIVLGMAGSGKTTFVQVRTKEGEEEANSSMSALASQQRLLHWIVLAR